MSFNYNILPLADQTHSLFSLYSWLCGSEEKEKPVSRGKSNQNLSMQPNSRIVDI